MNDPTRFDASEGVQRYRVTAEDYLRMIKVGAFDDAHVELVEGELIEMAPSGPRHGKAYIRISADLDAIYHLLGYSLFGDTILTLSAATVRAPDIAVVDADVDADVGDASALLPADVLLVVEIAQTTLPQDLGAKRVDYAKAGIRNYWVVDLANHQTHCFTDPQASDYAATTVIAFGEPLGVPGTTETITIK